MRPPRSADPVTGVLDEWCAWHERWEMAVECGHCGTSLPACYAAVHLEYACVEYEASHAVAR